MGRAGALALIALLGLVAWPGRVGAQPVVTGDDAADRALARLIAREPTVDQVRVAALRWHRLAGDPQPGWARRARWAAALPRLSLRARRGTAFDLDRSSTAEGGWTGTTMDVDLWLEARAEWDLHRLVFDERELRAAEVGRRRRDLATDLARRVTTLYYQRRRLQVTAIYAPADDAAESARLQLRIQELGAQLDGLSGGALSARRRP